MPPTVSPSFLDFFVLHLAAGLFGLDEVAQRLSLSAEPEDKGYENGGREGKAVSGGERARKKRRAGSGAESHTAFSSSVASMPPGRSDDSFTLYWRTPLLKDVSNNGGIFRSDGIDDGDEALFVDLTFDFVSSSPQQPEPSSSGVADSRPQQESHVEVRLGALIEGRKDCSGADYVQSSPLSTRHLRAYTSSVDVELDTSLGASPVARLLAGALRLLRRRSLEPSTATFNEDRGKNEIRVNLYHPDLCESGVLAATYDKDSFSHGEGKIGPLALQMFLVNLRKEDTEWKDQEGRTDFQKNEAGKLEEWEARERLEAIFRTWWVGPADVAPGTNDESLHTKKQPVATVPSSSGEVLILDGGEDATNGVLKPTSRSSASDDLSRLGKRSETPPIVPSPMTSPSKLTQDSQPQTMAISLSQSSSLSNKSTTRKASSTVYVRQRGRRFNVGAGGKKKRGAVTFGKID